MSQPIQNLEELEQNITDQLPIQSVTAQNSTSAQSQHSNLESYDQSSGNNCSDDTIIEGRPSSILSKRPRNMLTNTFDSQVNSPGKCKEIILFILI
jgi:hypothetical protein